MVRASLAGYGRGMGNDGGTKYVGAVSRILLGLLPIGIGVYFLGLERNDWVPGPSASQRYAITIAIGTLLSVSGVLGVVKRRRESKAAEPPPPTFARKMSWHAGAILLAPPVAALIVLGARGYNIWNAEKSLFERAQRQNVAEAWDRYDAFVMRHHAELSGSRANEAEVERTAAAARRFQHLDDPAISRMRRRAERRAAFSSDSLFGSDVGGWLDALTPVREHLPLAEAGYREARFTEVMTAGTVTGLRIHREEFPNGPHWEATTEALREHYREAEARFAAMTAAGQGRPEGVAGLQALLRHLRENDVDASEIPVAFLPVAGLEAHLFEAALGEALGGASVLPVEPAFTAQENQRRQGSIVRAIDNALRAVVGDLFSVTESTPEESRTSPRFLMEYAVRPSGTVYVFDGQEALPPAEREVLVGIAMRFHATVQVPAGGPLPDVHTVGNHFTLEGAPAEHIRGGPANLSQTARAAAAYGAMAQSAFGDFQRQLVRAYGLGS